CRDLRETRAVALPGALRAAKNRRACVRMDDDTRAFVAGAPQSDRGHTYRRSDAGVLREYRKADAEIPALFAELNLPLAQLGIARARQRRIHGGREIAGVETQAGGQSVRRGRGSNEIGSPDVGGIAGELARKLVYHALDQEGGLGMAGAAVRTGRSAIGVDADELGVDMRNTIEACDRKPGIDRGHAWSHPERISAEIGDDPCLERADLPVATGGKLGILDLVAAVGGCQEAFTAAFLPSAGAAGARGERSEERRVGKG